jgi:hypothetical protein
MATSDNALDAKSRRRLENGVLYALAASSTKLQIPPDTRIKEATFYTRTLASLNIVGQRVGWMWDHIDYAVKLIEGAKKVNRNSADAKAVKTVEDLWTLVLKTQPGSPQP